MTEPKLTEDRVETWRPIDANPLFLGVSPTKNLGREWDSCVVFRLVREINERMAELFPAVPAPQPEAKAEPVVRIPLTLPPEDRRDYTCPLCGEWHSGQYFNPDSKCRCRFDEVTAAANARIAELTRERDEARAAEDGLRKWEINAFRAGVAAAKEACAKAVEKWEPRDYAGTLLTRGYAARIVRETEVPGP